MDLGTVDARRIINTGSASTLYSLYSTAATLVGRRREEVSLGLSFLRDGCCRGEDCAETLRQLTVINEVLSAHGPADAVWDIDRPDAIPPWKDNLAPTVTNCATLHTTSEGELLLPALMALLQYAKSTRQGVVVLG